MVATGGDPTRVTGRRFVGWFLETVLDFIVLSTLVALIGVNLKHLGRNDAITPTVQHEIALIYVLYLVWVIATKVITLAMFGWTPGMVMVAVRCVRWNGRPPGVIRALVRTIFFQLWIQAAGLLLLMPLVGGISFIAALAALPLIMSTSKSHKGPQDMLVGSYVVDSQYFNHMVLAQPDGGVVAGPPAVTRHEAEKILRDQGVDKSTAVAVFEAPRVKTGEPFLDKNLDTYVVWNEKQQSWLAFDKSNGAWVRIG